MLSMIIAIVAIGALALARGGSLNALANTKLHLAWLLLVGFALQLGFDRWSPEWLEGSGELAVLLVSNALVAIFVFANRHIAGMLLAGLGLALNVLVIASNGAMPVSERAAEDAGIDKSLDEAGLKHERLTDDTVLPWLGDVIGLPVLKEVLSVGDVVLTLGIVRLVYVRATSNRRGRHSLSAASG
jgi:hypothetical protein